MAESPERRAGCVVSPTLPGMDDPAGPEGAFSARPLDPKAAIKSDVTSSRSKGMTTTEDAMPDSPPKIVPDTDKLAASPSSSPPLSAADSPAPAPDSAGSADMLTSSILAEEEKMKKVTEDDEERLYQQHQQAYADMNAEIRAQRYKRLQFLLSKSNMYTNYLLGRMEKQAQEEREKQARREKKKQKQAEKAQQDAQEIRSSARSSKQPKTEMAPTRKRKATGSDQPEKKRRRKGEEEDDKDSEEDESTSQNSGSQNSTEVKSEPISQNEDESQNEKTVQSLLAGLGEKTEQPELLTGGTLRDYQMEGYKWLSTLYENGVNGILADEMGLGKTIQCIAAIADMCAHGVPGPFLVVAPLSVVPNWVSEFQRFTPKVPVILYHGTKDDRMVLRRKIKKKVEIKPGIKVQPVIVTSYEVTMNDRAHLANFPWKYLIVDEGHRVKNSQCRLIKELKMYSSTHRLLLTGTPLQNNLAELWSLLNFLLPEIFDDLASFETWFDLSRLDNKAGQQAIVEEEQKDQVLAMLHQILKPFMLRRMKCDVELNVPPKCEIIVYAPLSSHQAYLYKAALDKTIEDKIMKDEEKVKETEEQLGRGNRSHKKVNYNSMCETEEDHSPPRNAKKQHEEELYKWCDNFVMAEPKSALDQIKKKKVNSKAEVHLQMRNKLMLMRKICNHPYLIEYPLTPDGNYLINEDLVRVCGKMQLLDQMLTELIKRGHKVLIFSQMTSMLDIIGDYLYHRGHLHSRLDGSMQFTERVVQIDQFNKDADISVFLLSTRAGGLGLNLTAADTVIIFDSDWNPQCDLQAQDRCHRIGQTKPVVIYRLVTSNTIDQKIVERAAAKRKLEKMVIIKGKFKKGIQNFDTKMSVLTPEELMALLESKDFYKKVELEKRPGRDEVISSRNLQKLLDRSHLYKQWEEKKHSRATQKIKTEKTPMDVKVKMEEGENEESTNQKPEVKQEVDIKVELKEEMVDDERDIEGVFKTIETIQY